MRNPTRYQKIGRGGKVLASGATLTSVCKMGEGIIIDWKERRTAKHDVYPPSRTTWITTNTPDEWNGLLADVSRYSRT